MKRNTIYQKSYSALLVSIFGLASSNAATLVGDHLITEDSTASPAEDGSLTMDGRFLTVGYNTTLGGVTLQYLVTSGGNLANIAMIANDTSRAKWNWGYDDGNNGIAQQMELDSNNILSLFNRATSSAAGITLDPGDGSEGSASIEIDGAKVITDSAGVQSVNLHLGSGSIRGDGGFGVALGNDLPAVNDGSITIANSSRTIGSYDYSKGFLNMSSLSDPDQKLAIDPNQFVANSMFHFQSKEHFRFRSSEKQNQRELIAEFNTDLASLSRKASLMIANGTISNNQYSPAIIGNNQSASLAHYPSLMIQGTGASTQDVVNASDFAVIDLTARVHDGDPLNGSFTSFSNKDIFSVGNHGHEPSLRIAANGHVGLGTKNPEAQLHVTQNGKIDGDLSAGGNTLNVLQSGSVFIGKDVADGSVPLKVSADGSVVLAKAQGDISMGAFGN